MTDHTTRRTYLKTAAATGVSASLAAIAGCLDGASDDENGDDSDDPDEPPLPEFPMVEDPPDAVYLPTHRESMRMLDPIEAGDYTLAPMLSYPHPFWVVADEELSEEQPEDGTGVHLMFTVWDAETGVVLPVAEGSELRVMQDGEEVGSPRIPWSMLSQEMGFHFGDNVSLPGDGTYTVEVTLPALDVQLTGDLEGTFQESETASFEFEYDDEFRQDVVGGVEYLDEDEWGEPGALEPMDHGGHDHGDHEGHDDDGGHSGDDSHGDHDGDGHSDDGHGDHDGDGHSDDSHGDHGDHDGADDHGEHNGDDHHGDHDHHVPYSELPPADHYPGTHLEPDAESVSEDDELAESGDARFVVTLFESGSRFVDDDERYLLVSPRTPYNRVPLPDMSLTGVVERDGEAVSEVDLVQTIDGEYDLHYGTALEDVEAGDTVRIEIDSFPQVARHQGYETAFLEMPAVELTVPGGE
ncbi:hypothetical protein OB905_08775 [Halobacteria archaeon AArc-dxtr1]|nr:hypothetical protein [Halobacteria archaeon AArc-dxtr1]